MRQGVVLAMVLVLAALAVPSAALAGVTQTKTDPSGDGPDAYWGSPDVSSVTWDVGATNATFSISTTEFDPYVIQYSVFLDTNADGIADYKLQFIHSASTGWSGTVGPEQGTACTQSTPPGGGGGATLAPAASADGNTATVTFPLSDIGGATSFKWAVEGVAWNQGNGDARDFMPDRTFSCPLWDSEMYASGSDGDLRLSDGYQFPTPAGPSVTLDSPADGATVDQGATLQAIYSCSDYHGTQPASCSGQDALGNSVPSGGTVDTSTPGDHVFGVSVKDDQEATAVVQHHYFVKAPEGSTPGDGGGTPGGLPGGPGGSTGSGDPGSSGDGAGGGGGHYHVLDDSTSAQVGKVDPSYLPVCDKSSGSYQASACGLLVYGQVSECDENNLASFDPALCKVTRAAAEKAVEDYARKESVQTVELASPVLSRFAFSWKAGGFAPQIEDIAGQVVAVGSGNIVTDAGAGILSDAAAELISDHGAGVVAVGAGNVVGVGSGNLKPVNGARVVAVGAGNFAIENAGGTVVLAGPGEIKTGNVVGVGSGPLQVGLGQVVAVGAGGLSSSAYSQVVPLPAGGKQVTSISVNPKQLISDGGGSLISDGGGSFAHPRVVAAAVAAKPIVIATGSVSAKGPGVALMQIKLTPAGRKLMVAIRKGVRKRHGKHLKRLRFSTRTSYTPAHGGKPIVLTRPGQAKRAG